MRRIITADTVVAGDQELSPGWVAIEHTSIVDVGRGEPPLQRSGAAGESVDTLRGILIPGFVDVHTHGADGVDFADAVDGSIDSAIRWHLTHGTTTVVASLATAEIDDLARQAEALAAGVRRGLLRGVHLEGPWLSPGHRGAHSADLLREPTTDDLDVLLTSGAVRMVTIAPELPGAISTIERLVASGVVAAVGHTSGTFDDARRGFDAGATVATHLFNGMPPLHHRKPGPVGAALLDDRVFLELILDGWHLSDPIVAVTIAQAGDRVMAVSDSIAATGTADGEYMLAGTPIHVSDGVAKTIDTGSLAGSTRTIDTAFAALVHRHGRSLAHAAVATSGAAARALGFSDVGEIAAGRSADLVLVDTDLVVARVMKAGSWVR